jgi:hypothetical protein
MKSLHCVLRRHPNPTNSTHPTQLNQQIMPLKKGFPLPNIPRIASEPVDHILRFSLGFALRFVLCVLLTSLDAGVTALFGRTLYRATAHHPLWFVGVNLLFGALLTSLIRVWTLTFRGRSG